MTGLVAAMIAELREDPDALAELAAALAPHLPSGLESPAAGLTTMQAGARADVSEKTVRRALAAATLEGERRAGRWRITADALDRWTAGGCATAATVADDGGRPRSRPGRWAGAAAIAGDSANRGADPAPPTTT